MGKLSLYHYVLLASGLLAGLLMVVVSFFIPAGDASAYSVRAEIERTQTQWVLQNGNAIDRNGVSTLVAQDEANEILLHRVSESGSDSEKESEEITSDSSSSEFEQVMPLGEAETNPVEEGQMHQENEAGKVTPTPVSMDADSSVDGSSSGIDSISSADESIVGDHRFRAGWLIRIPNRRPTKTNTPVPTRTNTMVPTRTNTPTEQPVEDIFWKAGFETGNISEYSGYGDWIQQGTTPKYEVQSSIVHSGDYAVKFTIDTSSLTSQAAYLFFWNTLPDAAYYSAWYYIPSNVEVQHWWNIMQWKSTYNGNSDYSRPVFNLGAGSKQTLGLCYLPDVASDKVCWDQGVKLPKGRWFHIETYYDRDKVDGRVIVWVDGVQLYDVSGYPTVLSDGTLHWSVNHYSDDILPNPSSIYIDDVVIAYGPVGH
jgi:hypothetical protein